MIEEKKIRYEYLLEIHVWIDSMDREEGKIRNNIVLFDPNHQNNEQEHFSSQFQLPEKENEQISFFEIMKNILLEQ